MSTVRRRGACHRAALPEICLFAIVMLAFAGALLTTGCAAMSRPAAMPTAVMAEATPTEPPPPLERSLFARTPQGALEEDALQRIIAAPIDLALPARVGVLPIVGAADWRGPSPDDNVPRALAPFAETLVGASHFSLITQLVPIPSGSLGMEALREQAARYGLRYVILYREVLQKSVRSNGWAWGYATLLGALFIPGETLRVSGFVEASLFDVKTGLLLFTVRQPVAAERDTNVWHNDDKLESLAARATLAVAQRLGGDVRRATEDLERTAALEQKQRRATSEPTATLSKVETDTPPVEN